INGAPWRSARAQAQALGFVMAVERRAFCKVCTKPSFPQQRGSGRGWLQGQGMHVEAELR
ncbi:UNVERIFIED_CONTAM: hypothetical protein Sradi_7070400, partial [Sesamum radiatum]